MKKYLSLWLGFCLIVSLAVPALASDSLVHYWEEYRIYIPAPSRDQYSSEEEYSVAYDAWYSGLEQYIAAQEEARLAAEDAREAGEEQSLPAETTPVKSTESERSNDVYEVSAAPPSAPADPGNDDKYPVGSRVDPAGNVYSSDGELLSPGTTPASEPYGAASAALGVLASQDPSEAPAAEADQPVYYLTDLRSDSDAAGASPAGLKALVISIFGEYTPVTTTSVVSESVGSEVDQYLVEAVASGAAGVDYEWLAGVFLFGLLLFCFMKLLGGVLK